MAIDFFSPVSRAADLAVTIAPLGLVDLSSEEFDVHGVRLQRYASCLAWYVGHHWTYRREIGDHNITLNYCRALSDYITTFCFGKGVHFRAPEANNAIIPHLLEKVWNGDNQKLALLWEIGQIASITGDVFVKVAYEPEWVDSAGVLHEGRTRIIPITPDKCFPEFAPHDRSRMIRFKLKYRYYSLDPDGTRTVKTFTEIITDTLVQQFINDELVDEYPNPIGMIPVVHIANRTIPGSPWGLSDIWDILSLNRELNEKMTDISDIVSYYSAPVTVITGAKAANLERGPKKVWAINNEKAQVRNLESAGAPKDAIEYITLIKRTMHELTGVPESALGQTQPVSNTSGVALAIQYQPMMAVFRNKQNTFSKGFERVNELIIRTQATFEPWTLAWDPTIATEPEKDQLFVLDPQDPRTYQTSCHWPDPLPVDQLIKLNEIQVKMMMGIESKRGALRELGEEFPNEKMTEIFEEQMQDLVDQGAMQLLSADIAAGVFAHTGLLPSTGGMPVETGGGSGEEGGGQAPALPGISPSGEMVSQLTQRAYGAGLAQYRSSDDPD